MLSRTASLGAIFTGLFFLLAIGALTFIPERAGGDLTRVAIAQFLFAFFLAHFAVEAYSSEWDGGRALPQTQVGIVALRYMALVLGVAAPLLAIARSRDAVMAMLMAPKASTILIVIYVLVIIASPPALLIVAVSATSAGDLVSPEHWRSRFSGRRDDYFLIYTLFIGALVVVTLVCTPIIAFAATRGQQAMTITGAAIGTFASGFAISLLGRLCGSFAIPPEPEVAEKRAALHPALSQFERPAQTATPSTPRKTALLEAGSRVELLRTKHSADPEALIAGLRELDESFLPNQAVRQALVLALVAAGHQQEAVALAHEAIPLCIKSGGIGPAAHLYEALMPYGESFGLGKDQLIQIGDSLRSMKRTSSALDVYRSVLRSQPGDTKAMKGMIALAEELSQRRETVAESKQIYDYLIEHCAASPLVDFVRTERAKLDRKFI